MWVYIYKSYLPFGFKAFNRQGLKQQKKGFLIYRSIRFLERDKDVL